MTLSEPRPYKKHSVLKKKGVYTAKREGNLEHCGVQHNILPESQSWFSILTKNILQSNQS